MPSFTLPIFPLPRLVHFPGTVIQLHVFEARYQRLVEDLMALPPAERRLGIVLLREDGELSRVGTVTRLLDVEYLRDGRSNIDLFGEYRFCIEQELTTLHYRRALVRGLDTGEEDSTAPIASPLVHRLLQTSSQLAAETGISIVEEEHGGNVEILVNQVACQLGLPVPQQQNLLESPLGRRLEAVVAALDGQHRVLDLLRPFRRETLQPELN